MISPGSVKICSLREVEHAQVVLEAGADLFGLIFVPGVRRQVTIDRAREIVDAIRENPAGVAPLAVGVFVNASTDHINETARLVGLDLIQLHGEEAPEFLEQLEKPVIKVIRLKAGMDVGELDETLYRYAAAKSPPVAYHVEGYHDSHHGGEGIGADWSVAAGMARKWPVLLAGGLNPDNVADGIRKVCPLGVDVSSGVERDGFKDPAKISAFVKNAKSAFAALADQDSRK